MDAQLQEMLDHYAITRLLADYAHACDRCDTERMAATYWPDSWDDHGRDKMPGPEFSVYMTRDVIPASCETLSHLLGQTRIMLDGDRAGAETYYIAVTRDAAPDGAPRCNQLGGRYVDQIERRSGEWRIKRRTCLRDWSVSMAVADDYFAHAELTPGARSGADPSYPVLGWTHSAGTSTG